ncbi:hypothetical protein NC653_006005 [Populus alba x Populus x berolinensis]|uniref:Uncharacterized protein n=1 Tax=Populus alba x Populus x berolinensis TaxID=444605 RepID=A0AAD6WBN2_9ROSI|nr:hypothetical protein NC653_006005 [Populus alba x Populus x berolinensis]
MAHGTWGRGSSYLFAGHLPLPMPWCSIFSIGPLFQVPTRSKPPPMI